jgi:mannose-1-phosphate guanylyltransferase
MKAFLLAAGKGTRLRPVSFHTPKCLVPICEKPLIEYWFEIFEEYGVREILVNTSHHSKKVRDYVDNHPRAFRTRLTYEKRLLGSGGTIRKNLDFVKGEDSFFIFYADNLTDINLKNMIEFHDNHKKDFTLALIRVKNPRECGIVEIDDHSNVVSFIEKPDNPGSDLAFAGIMLCGQTIQNFFPRKEIFDLGYDVLPKLAGNAVGYIMSDYLLDIGTPEKLIQAEDDVKHGKLRVKDWGIDSTVRFP